MNHAHPQPNYTGDNMFTNIINIASGWFWGNPCNIFPDLWFC